MKTSVFVSVVIVLSVMSSLMFGGRACALQNEPEEFRGISWGASVKEQKDMAPLSDPGTSFDVSYTRKDDELKMGDAELKSIKYGFFDNRFYMVVLEVAGRANFDKLKAAAEQKYGAGVRSNPRYEQYSWKGKKVDMDLFFSSLRKEGRLIIVFRPLYRERKIAEKFQAIEESRQPHYPTEEAEANQEEKQEAKPDAKQEAKPDAPVGEKTVEEKKKP